MCSQVPGLFTSTIPAIVIPLKTSSDTNRPVAVVVVFGIFVWVPVRELIPIQDNHIVDLITHERDEVSTTRGSGWVVVNPPLTHPLPRTVLTSLPKGPVFLALADARRMPTKKHLPDCESSTGCETR